MSQLFALLVSDPNLMACELRRSEEAWDIARSGDQVEGIGSYVEDDLVLQDAVAEAPPRPPSRLWRGGPSPVLLYIAGSRSGSSFDGQTQPRRFRRWLFGQSGRLPESTEARERVHRSLPEFLRRQVAGLSEGEVAFGVFLRKLHEAGALDNAAIPVATAAKLLASTVRVLLDLYASAGAAGPSVGLVVSNGSLLVSARHGRDPLWYRVHEGLEGCRACELAEGDGSAKAKLHRRMRSLVVASRVKDPGSWTELPSERVLAADTRIESSVGAI